MIRFSVVKTGDKLGGHANQDMKIEDQTGANEWNPTADGDVPATNSRPGNYFQ